MDEEIRFNYGPLSRDYGPEGIKILEELSREYIPQIFDKMVEMVQDLEGWAFITANGLPEDSVSFKPGLGDKFLLRKLFEKYFPPKGPWPILDSIHPEAVALRILEFEYCPRFGSWDAWVLKQHPDNQEK